MPYSSLADFLEELSARGELARVGAEVDAELEIAEVTRRVAQQGGPALLFDRVRGQTAAVVTNLMGTPCRVCRALGIESLEAIAERTESLIEKNTPHNWFDRLKTSADEAGANKFRPKSVKSGPCQQVVRLGRDVLLASFPLTKQWPAESGPSITAGQLITQERGGEARSVTICPLVAIDENRLAIADDGHGEFARHWSTYRAAGEKMPAAVVLGGDPAGLVAGHIDVAAGSDIYHMAGLLRGKAVELVKCRTHALEVPVEADFIFEGYLDPETAPVSIESAGAGGSHYRIAHTAPVLHVTAITHRSHPIFPVIVDGGPDGESGALVKARERMLLPALRAIAPDVVDLHLGGFGELNRWAFVAIRKRYPFHARQIAAALWGSTALRFTKFLILVDADVNVQDVKRVLTEVGANVAPERDVFSHDGPAHGSDHANSLAPLARHLAIDATAKILGEQAGNWPAALAASEETRQLVTSRWAEYKLELAAHIK
jgi:4-hydroxy-3-polyprenylbenzoate decarboxylase